MISFLNDEQDSMKQSFQDGVDTLYNKCVSCGSTPSNKTPTAISNSIQSIYNNRYNEGYNNGKEEGSSVTFLGSKLTRSSGEWLKYTYTVTENCYILVIIGAFGYNNLLLQRNGSNVNPTTKIDNQYENQTHLYAYSLKCNKNDILFADSEPGSYNSRSTICMIFKT